MKWHLMGWRDSSKNCSCNNRNHKTRELKKEWWEKQEKWILWNNHQKLMLQLMELWNEQLDFCWLVLHWLFWWIWEEWIHSTMISYWTFCCHIVSNHLKVKWRSTQNTNQNIHLQWKWLILEWQSMIIFCKKWNNIFQWKEVEKTMWCSWEKHMSRNNNLQF